MSSVGQNTLTWASNLDGKTLQLPLTKINALDPTVFDSVLESKLLSQEQENHIWFSALGTDGSCLKKTSTFYPV